MVNKYLIEAAYLCGSVESQWFVSSSRKGSDIGASNCPLYGNDLEACDADKGCGKVVVFNVKPYSETEARRLKATDLTRTSANKKGLAEKVTAAA